MRCHHRCIPSVLNASAAASARRRDFCTRLFVARPLVAPMLTRLKVDRFVHRDIPRPQRGHGNHRMIAMACRPEPQCRDPQAPGVPVENHYCELVQGLPAQLGRCRWRVPLAPFSALTGFDAAPLLLCSLKSGLRFT